MPRLFRKLQEAIANRSSSRHRRADTDQNAPSRTSLAPDVEPQLSSAYGAAQSDEQADPSEPLPLDNLSPSKRYHQHLRHGRFRNNTDADVLEEGICTKWYQPVFRGSVFAIKADDEASKNDEPSNSTGREDGLTRDTRAFRELKIRPLLPEDMRDHGLALRSEEKARLNQYNADEFPTLLVDIRTGAVVNGEKDLAYVIGSYVCRPDMLPAYPRVRRRDATDGGMGKPSRDFQGDAWEYSTAHFDEVVRMVKAAEKNSAECLPKFWILDDSVDMGSIRQRRPAPQLPVNLSHQQREYITEIYYYIAAEATLLGVSHIWLDCLCINQEDPKALAREIPRMHTYYRGARRCVVVSEMLRRGLSHNPDHLGLDLLDPTLDAELPAKCFDEAHRQRYGLLYEAIGWLIGFHQLRVWLFQETYLSRDLVHRGRNIRLNTRDILTYGIRSLDQDANDNGRYNPEVQLRRQCQKTLQRRIPISSAMNGEVFHPNYCLGLIQSQGRKTVMEADYIFGLLGLFERPIRKLIPTEYGPSLPALSAMLVYARVSTGDLLALFYEEPNDDSPSQRHAISDAPAWMPQTTVQMAYQDSGLNLGDQAAGGSLDDGTPLVISRLTHKGHLVLRAAHYPVRAVRLATPADKHESVLQQSDHTNPHADKTDWRSENEPRDFEIQPGDIVLELAVRPQLTVHLYIQRRHTPGEQRALDIAAQAGRAQLPMALACVETSKLAHFWVLLAARDVHGTTWRILGRIETGLIHGGMLASGMESPGVAEFTII